MFTLNRLGMGLIILMWMCSAGCANNRSSVVRDITASESGTNTFLRDNPDYRQRAGKHYETKYLPETIEQLKVVADLNKQQVVVARNILKEFIYDWLDTYIEAEGGTHELSAEAHASVVEIMDSRMRRELPEIQYDKYLDWRKGDPPNSNALAFIMRPYGLRSEAELAGRHMLEILPWPDNEGPGGFMQGLVLVALPTNQCEKIVKNIKPTEKPFQKPEFKTPREVAEYFGSHLNMGEPPKYMIVYDRPDGRKYYLFSGGIHWKKWPPFSEAAVLLETGEIMFYERSANKVLENTGSNAPDSQH